MKKAITVLLIIAALISILASCGNDKNGGSNTMSDYQKFREEFLSSDVYKTAHTFVSEIIETVFKTKEYDVSIEPKSVSSKKYDNFTDFKENAETRLSFCEEYFLVVTISCVDEEIDPEAVCQQFINSKLTGKLYDPMTSMSFFYNFYGNTGKFEKELIPGV